MQLVLMNQSADQENKEPASDCKKASFKRKEKLSHYLKIVPLMCCEQRAVSLKGPNSFYLEYFICSRIINKILNEPFKQSMRC